MSVNTILIYSFFENHCTVSVLTQCDTTCVPGLRVTLLWSKHLLSEEENISENFFFFTFVDKTWIYLHTHLSAWQQEHSTGVTTIDWCFPFCSHCKCEWIGAHLCVCLSLSLFVSVPFCVWFSVCVCVRVRAPFPACTVFDQPLLAWR